MKLNSPFNSEVATAKFFLAVIIISMITANAFSQAMEVTFNTTSYAGGYHVSCNGAANGRIDATIVNGTAPYTFQWSNGATTQNLNNIVAGTYTLTVNDNASHTKIKTITLLQAAVLQASLGKTHLSGKLQCLQIQRQ